MPNTTHADAAPISALPMASGSDSTLVQQHDPALSVTITPTNTPLTPLAHEKELVLNSLQSPLNVEPEIDPPVHGAEDVFKVSVNGKTPPIGRQNPSVSAFKQPPPFKLNEKGPYAQQPGKKIITSPIRAQPLSSSLPPTPQQQKAIVVNPIPPLHTATFQTPSLLRAGVSRACGKQQKRVISPKDALVNPKKHHCQPEMTPPKDVLANQKKGKPTSPTPTSTT